MSDVGSAAPTSDPHHASVGCAIEIHGATASLGGSMLLESLEFRVEAGTIVGIGGENGAGKSTLLRVVAGLVEVDRGHVAVFGAPPMSRSAQRRVGCAIDTPAFYSWMSAKGHLRTAQLMAGRDDAREVAVLLRQFGLGDTGRKPIFRFSQGMKKRLALAQAALGGPDLLLLDEPTNALDPAGRDDVWSWLAEERDVGTAIVVVSHRGTDRDQCDAWFELADGRLERG